MNVKKLKNCIKRTSVYQAAHFWRYPPLTHERMMKLPETEQSRKRICLQFHSKISQIEKMLKQVQITLKPNQRYQSWIDTGLYCSSVGMVADNIPPDYSLIVGHSLSDLIAMMSKYQNNISENNIRMFCAVEQYIDRVIGEIDRMLARDGDCGGNLSRCRNYFVRMKCEKATSLDEAFQRILFWQSMFWQSNHRLVGLGRLDKILQQFAGEADAVECITEFCRELHKYFAYKSNSVALGDTGQIILLGGTEADGSYFCNSLTYDFMRAFLKLRLPDPKLLLRVSSNMPEDLLSLALNVIATGAGFPLLSNDDVVIPSLEEFGYTHEDACNYVVSACWEPLVYGKSLEKNNIGEINYAAALTAMYRSEGFGSCETYADVWELYSFCLAEEARKVMAKVDTKQWEKDPLMTLFTEGCLESGKDIGEGGAKYSNYGILTVGMENAVNSLLNIKNLVFSGDDSISLQMLSEAAMGDFTGCGQLKNSLSKGNYFGHDDDEVICLVKAMQRIVAQALSGYRNQFGGKVKWGLSSSNYVESGKKTGATLDGRNAGMPLGVHISSKDGAAYTELIAFASKLDYAGQNANGNVVDFIVSPVFMRENLEKFIRFIRSAISVGFFQLQMNVLDSATLIEAKKNPDQFPTLIVRVWGFSAYFNDLPEEYKDLLIDRAVASEKCA